MQNVNIQDVKYVYVIMYFDVVNKCLRSYALRIATYLCNIDYVENEITRIDRL